MIEATLFFARLARHDFTLMGRRIAAMTRGSGRRTIVFVGIAIAVFHVIAWPLAQTAAQDMANDARSVDFAVAAGLALVLPWIVSQALTNATRALYARGDLDLLLASPVSPAALFAARALAIAAESIASVAIFVLPVSNMLAIAAGPRWLAIYPMLAICGFFGTAIGLVLTVILFRIAGPRRTRTLAQVFATVIGASFALGIQVANFLPPALVERISAALPAHEGSMWRTVVGMPVRATTGDAGALAVLAIVAITLFAAVATLLGFAFTRGLAQATDAPTKTIAGRQRASFRTGAGQALRRKEWRLLRRDPWLASQMLLQVAYTVPLCYVLWQTLGPEQGPVAAISPAVVVIAAQAAGALAWITLSTEDAPEFLRTAPLGPGAVEAAKLMAVAMPLAVVLGVPLLAMTVYAPAAAAVTLAFATAAACSTALLNLWRPAPSKRGDVLRRTGQSKVVSMLEHVLALLWAVAAALFAAGSLMFLAPVVIALVFLLANRRQDVSALR